MQIQKSLLKEQIELWQNSKLAKTIIKENTISTLDDFKKVIPLTTYDDYADVLLCRDDRDLPVRSALWIETTWEGGTRPDPIDDENDVCEHVCRHADNYRKETLRF